MRDDESFVQSIKAYVATALTVVVGLAWNSAFTDLFARVSWMRRWGPFVYALLVTVIAFVAVRTLHATEKTLQRLSRAR